MSFIAELKRRNVFKVGVAYVIVAWLIAQVIAVVHAPLHLPGWFATAVIVFLIIGFPIALLLAWAFELTPDGIKPTETVAPAESITYTTGQKLNYIIITLLSLAVVFLVIDNYVLTGHKNEETVISEKKASETDNQETTPAVVPIEQSVAVLPFVNMSDDPAQEYFSDGIAEELLNQLSKLRGLQVAGRTSSFSFKGKDEDLRVIGEKLNVNHIIEGSVRKAGNRVRITVQLIKVDDGYHLWSESYDRELDDIFAIQEETARAVADALSISLGVGDLATGGTRNFAAYDAYLAGRSLYNQISGKEAVSRAIEQLELAVALDPEFADAWFQLAVVYSLIAPAYFLDRAGEFMKKSRTAASRAITIAPDSMASLRATGLLHFQRREWGAAEQSYQKRLALAPSDSDANFSYGYFLIVTGRTSDSKDYLHKVIRVDPLSSRTKRFLSLAHFLNGDVEAALMEIERSKELTGEQSLQNVFRLIFAIDLGDRALMEEALDMTDDTNILSPATIDMNRAMFDNLDTPDVARAELHRLYEEDAHDKPILNAMAHWASNMGDHELALKLYHEIIKSKSDIIYLPFVWLPSLKPMRQLPGFKDLVRDLGLVEYWRATGNWGDFCRPVGDDDFECE